MAKQTGESGRRDDVLGPFIFTTDLNRQLEASLLLPFEGQGVGDVLVRASSPAEGRRNPKVFILTREVDVQLYRQLTVVTLQLTDLKPDSELNFDIIPASALPLIPKDALSVRQN